MLASDIVLSYENDKFINLLGSKNGKKSPSGFKTIISKVFATSDLIKAELLLEVSKVIQQLIKRQEVRNGQ